VELVGFDLPALGSVFTSRPYASFSWSSQTRVLLRFRLEVPVDFRLRRRIRVREVGARVLGPCGFRSSGFKERHFPIVHFGKTVSHNAASSAGTNDDKIDFLRERMSVTIRIHIITRAV